MDPLVIFGVILCVALVVCWIGTLTVNRLLKTKEERLDSLIEEMKSDIGKHFIGPFTKIVGNMRDEAGRISGNF